MLATSVIRPRAFTCSMLPRAQPPLGWGGDPLLPEVCYGPDEVVRRARDDAAADTRANRRL